MTFGPLPPGDDPGPVPSRETRGRAQRASYAVALVLGLGGTGTLAVASSADPPDPTPPAPDPVPILYQGKPIRWWAARAVAARRDANARRRTIRKLEARERAGARELARERRILLADPDVAEAINLAAATYGFGSTLWRKARCETGGTFSPRAYNASGASGLFQFLPSTWATTPYAAFSIWSPYANALAAGWMHDQGRGGEWTCR